MSSTRGRDFSMLGDCSPREVRGEDTRNEKTLESFKGGESGNMRTNKVEKGDEEMEEGDDVREVGKSKKMEKRGQKHKIQ